MATTNNPLEELTQDERNRIVARYAATAELWLRNLIHRRLSAGGTEYITKGTWKNQLKDKISNVITAYPGKYRREIDATSFEGAIYMLTHGDAWRNHFDTALNAAYPFGFRQASLFLTKIKDARNDVGHLRGCSVRQVEQTICYANDLVDSIKDFYRKQNMHKEFNVPMIVRYADNKRNNSNLEGISTNLSTRHIDWRGGPNGDLRPGDTLVSEIEVDQSFPSDEYDITHAHLGGHWHPGPIFKLPISNAHVGEQLEIRFRIITKRDWHRHFGVDDMLITMYRVLPPINLA